MGQKVKNTWVVVAHRGGARVFTKTGNNEIAKVFDLENPKGRLKNSDINSDEGGRAFQRLGPGSSGLSKGQDPVAHVAEAFAKSLGDRLNEGAYEHRFDALVLVAEPHFLGLLRAELAPTTAALVTQSLPKDFGTMGDTELTRELPSIVA